MVRYRAPELYRDGKKRSCVVFHLSLVRCVVFDFLSHSERGAFRAFWIACISGRLGAETYELISRDAESVHVVGSRIVNIKLVVRICSLSHVLSGWQMMDCRRRGHVSGSGVV